MFLNLFSRIETPPRKAVLLTTFFCAFAGGLTELVNAIEIHWNIGFGFYSPAILFSIAILVAFRKTGAMTVVSAVRTKGIPQPI